MTNTDRLKEVQVRCSIESFVAKLPDPALLKAYNPVNSRKMALAVGAMVGPYEVLAPLGAGGMGEVYRARDPRLGREVAIKVLPEEFSADAERLHRFDKEARAAAALNHPNILAVYDIGTHNGAPYIVSELLEGETLRERLAQSDSSRRSEDRPVHKTGSPLPGGGRASARLTPLAVRKAVEYAVQMAHGLAAAHEKGIVHRDPECPSWPPTCEPMGLSLRAGS